MIKYYDDLIQGSDAWHAVRCGLLTASEMSLIITPKKMEIAKNDKAKTHLYELLAQRVTGYVEPSFISDDMLRGISDEVRAKIIYVEKYNPITETGFVVNDEWGFTIGFSPDGLVGDDGLIECKSRRQKFQMQTIISDEVPEEYILQLQTGMLVTDRSFCDFVSYCGGLPLFVKRVYADVLIQKAIIEAAAEFEYKVEEYMQSYKLLSANLYPTERKVEEEITL